MPTDSKTAEIVATLRAFAASFYRCFGPSNGEHDTLVSAADLLEAKDREIEELRRQLQAALRDVATGEDEIANLLKANQRDAASIAQKSAEIERLEKERDHWRRRGDNHWETLRSIREMAREGDCARIILWVGDAGSGYIETSEATLKSAYDERNSATARASALEAERDKLREGLAVARAALEKSLEVFRNGLANRAFNGALYSHALTASHLINNAFILLTPSASGAEQGGEDGNG